MKLQTWLPVLFLVIGLTSFGCGGEDDEDSIDTTPDSSGDTKEVEEDISESPEEALPCPRAEGNCELSLPTEMGPGFRVNTFSIGSDGTEGQALNIDPEAGEDDCQPEGKCDGGFDNALSVLGGFANDGLGDALDNGKLMIIATTEGSLDEDFTLLLYSGNPDEGTCAFQTDFCSYSVSPTSWGCDCELRATMKANLTDGVLTAGGDDATFNFIFPIDEDTLELTAVRARLIANATVTDEGILLSELIIGGAVRQSTLVKTIEDHPSETFGPVSKGTIITVIESILPDVDTDGDGIDDGLSVGLIGTAIPATLSGILTL